MNLCYIYLLNNYQIVKEGTKEEILEDNIDVIPLHITIGGKEYLDRVDITSEEFFKKLIENTELPKTSQATPISFINEFEKFPDDEIICITMSKKLSGTYQSACVAASDFDNVCVIDSENVTVVDFWAPWCGPCRKISPIIDELSTELAGKVKVVKVNTDENLKITQEFSISGIPSILIFNKGEAVERLVGLMQKSQLIANLEKHL